MAYAVAYSLIRKAYSPKIWRWLVWGPRFPGEAPIEGLVQNVASFRVVLVRLGTSEKGETQHIIGLRARCKWLFDLRESKIPGCRGPRKARGAQGDH
jgi:hypothetical protein